MWLVLQERKNMVIAPSLSNHVLGLGITDQQCGGGSIPRHRHSPASRYRENRARTVMVDPRSYGIEAQWFV